MYRPMNMLNNLYNKSYTPHQKSSQPIDPQTSKKPKKPKKTIPPIPTPIFRVRTRIVPVYNSIDPDYPLNISKNKTIISVLGHDYGFGDYLRGSITLAQYAKKYKVQFKMNVSRHLIHQCIVLDQEDISKETPIHNVKYGVHTYTYLENIISQFISSSDIYLYIETNLFYNTDLYTRDIQDKINTQLLFKSNYYDQVKSILPFNTYYVLHIRCDDTQFYTQFNDDNLYREIYNLKLPKNTIVISNNYSIKKIIHAIFKYPYIDIQASHFANTDISGIENTVIDYIILSKSIHTYCFSYYGHGSGLSEQCSVLHNIPYTVSCIEIN